MKKPTKLLTLAFLALGGGLLTGCDNGPKIVIGILQPVEHGALSAARKGFMEALKTNYKGDKKLKFEYKNANGVEADQNTLAKSLANKADLLLGIGTGASVALKSAEIEAGFEKPLLFTAVTDPVDAQLVSSMKNHGGFVTGTSDDNPVEAQVNLLTSCFPNKANLKLGVIYTASEINSEVQANRAKEEAEKHNISVQIATCTDSSDIRTAATSLCANVDAIYVPTDNNIAANMPIIKEAVDNSHTLAIVGESNMLAGGGHITYSIDYTLLGKRTGEMAAQILNEEKTAGEIDCEKMLDEQYIEQMISSKNLRDSEITLPSDLLADFTDIDA